MRGKQVISFVGCDCDFDMLVLKGREGCDMLGERGKERLGVMGDMADAVLGMYLVRLR